MYLRNAAGERLVPGLDVYCRDHNAVGQIMGTQMLLKRCLIQLRNGALIFMDAAEVVIASWSHIGYRPSATSAETRVAGLDRIAASALAA